MDINNLTTIALISQAAVARMQTWYEDGLYQCVLSLRFGTASSPAVTRRWTAWWQVPVLGMAYANLDLALGNQGRFTRAPGQFGADDSFAGNKLLIEDLLNKNSDLGYMIDDYIDDQSACFPLSQLMRTANPPVGWWAMFALRGYELYGNETWLDATVKIAANNTLYWDESCGGGVLWLTWRPLIKNTITNG